MPDSSNIDNALIAKLASDSTLLALCPNGVYWAEAPPVSTRFVIVSFVESHDEQMFGGRAFEMPHYTVKAVMRSNAGGNIQAAAARIDVLLEQQPLTVTGYTVTCVRRVSPIRETEVDDLDEAIRWQHRGGVYEVTASS